MFFLNPFFLFHLVRAWAGLKNEKAGGEEEEEEEETKRKEREGEEWVRVCMCPLFPPNPVKKKKQ